MPLLIDTVLMTDTALIGFLFVARLSALTQVERLGLAFLIGTLWLSFVSFTVHVFFNQPYSLSLVVITLALGSTLGVVISGKPGVKKLVQLKQVLQTAFSPYEKIAIGIIVLVTASSVFQNYIWPITDWDALALYDFRARVLLIQGEWTEGTRLGYFYQYPPYTSLLHAISYLSGSEKAKLWYSGIYFSFILVFYAQLRRTTTRNTALLGAAFLAVSPDVFGHATVAYTNLAYTTFFVSGCIYLWQWYGAGQKTYLLLGTLSIAASLWVRLTEPFWIVAILLLIAGAAKHRQHIMAAVSGLLLIWGMKYYWSATVAIIIQGEASAPPTLQPPAVVVPPLFERVATKVLATLGMYAPHSSFQSLTLAIIWQHVTQVNSYLFAYVAPLFMYLLVPLVLVLWYEVRSELSEDRKIILGTLGIIVLMLWSGTFVFSFIFETWDEIGGSAQRMSMFMPPLILFFVMSSPIWKHLGSSSSHR